MNPFNQTVAPTPIENYAAQRQVKLENRAKEAGAAKGLLEKCLYLLNILPNRYITDEYDSYSLAAQVSAFLKGESPHTPGTVKYAAPNTYLERAEAYAAKLEGIIREFFVDRVDNYTTKKYRAMREIMNSLRPLCNKDSPVMNLAELKRAITVCNVLISGYERDCPGRDLAMSIKARFIKSRNALREVVGKLDNVFPPGHIVVVTRCDECGYHREIPFKDWFGPIEPCVECKVGHRFNDPVQAIRVEVRRP